MFEKYASKGFKIRALIILILGFITMYCSGMFGTDIINVVQNPITEKLGCSTTSAVLGWTVGGYTVIFVAFIFSTIIMKRGVHGFASLAFIVMGIGAILVSVGYSMNSLALITIGGFLLKNFLQALQLSIFQVIARWFEKSRGFVLGLMGAAFALDNSTSSTGLTFLYGNLGFNGMMMIVAVVMFLMGVLSFIFIRTTPEEFGLTVDGLPQEKEVHTESPMEFQSKWNLKTLLSLKESWSILIGIGVFNLTLSAVISQFFNSLLHMNVSMNLCMTYMLIFGLLGIVISPVFGKLIDKMGAPKAGIVISFLYCISVAGFCFQIPLLAACSIAFFVGAPIIQPALTMHVFGGPEYPAVNRYLSIGSNLIGACGIPLMTVLYDTTGSYHIAYYLLLALNILVLILMSICKNTYIEGIKKENYHEKDEFQSELGTL